MRMDDDPRIARVQGLPLWLAGFLALLILASTVAFTAFLALVSLTVGAATAAAGALVHGWRRLRGKDSLFGPAPRDSGRHIRELDARTSRWRNEQAEWIEVEVLEKGPPLPGRR